MRDRLLDLVKFVTGGVERADVSDLVVHGPCNAVGGILRLSFPLQWHSRIYEEFRGQRSGLVCPRRDGSFIGPRLSFGDISRTSHHRLA